ncbi:hypothetical protein [Iningainema tapete]|uniref:Uncharacterized protein n=1 Tax=Iningainema tapete BLCC-T55 TaxID=2748662 RepID=A0A8J7CAT1_9CYAN|nr:hypothetical protein [Iningainema tapete]MBD2777511.1 hypothetical protein [Iningainema tapete BLCC-T55]
MSAKTNCLCCSGSLLRHVRRNQVHWFCKSCWQEVPRLSISQSQGLVVSNHQTKFSSLMY